MKKLKIFIYHLIVFVLGSIGLVIYTFINLGSPKNAGGVGGVIAMPVIAFFYIVLFGILCLISLLFFLLFTYLKRPKA